MGDFYLGILVGIAGTIILSASFLGLVVLATAAEGSSIGAWFQTRR